MDTANDPRLEISTFPPTLPPHWSIRPLCRPFRRRELPLAPRERSARRCAADGSIRSGGDEHAHIQAVEPSNELFHNADRPTTLDEPGGEERVRKITAGRT